MEMGTEKYLKFVVDQKFYGRDFTHLGPEFQIAQAHALFLVSYQPEICTRLFITSPNRCKYGHISTF